MIRYLAKESDAEGSGYSLGSVIAGAIIRAKLHIWAKKELIFFFNTLVSQRGEAQSGHYSV